MSRVTQLGLGAISPIVQYLLELPGKFGNRCGRDLAGRKQPTGCTIFHPQKCILSLITSHKTRYHNAHFTDEQLRLRERKNLAAWFQLERAQVKETNFP